MKGIIEFLIHHFLKGYHLAKDRPRRKIHESWTLTTNSSNPAVSGVDE